MKGARGSRLRGLTLIEVLVALAILSIALLALAPMFMLGVRTNASSDELGVANTLAREKLEELTGYPSTDPRLSVTQGQTTTTYPTNDLPSYFNPTTGQTAPPATKSGNGWYPYPYSRTYTVTACDAQTMTPVASAVTDESLYDAKTANPYYGLKLVTVSVQPIRPDGTPSGILPGLRVTRQSAYVRFKNVPPPS